MVMKIAAYERPRPSWGEAERATYSKRLAEYGITMAKAATLDEARRLYSKEDARLDRLYNNTSMPAEEFARYDNRIVGAFLRKQEELLK